MSMWRLIHQEREDYLPYDGGAVFPLRTWPNAGDRLLKMMMDACHPPRLFSNLTNIYLPGEKVSDDGVTHLANALVFMPSLRKLHLRNNIIGDRGVTALSLALPPALYSLDLSDNKIMDEGAKALFSQLQFRHRESQLVLDLCANPIGTEGVKAIAKWLICHTLDRLSLFDNPYVGSEGVKSLIDARYYNFGCKSPVFYERYSRESDWRTLDFNERGRQEALWKSGQQMLAKVEKVCKKRDKLVTTALVNKLWELYEPHLGNIHNAIDTQGIITTTQECLDETPEFIVLSNLVSYYSLESSLERKAKIFFPDKEVFGNLIFTLYRDCVCKTAALNIKPVFIRCGFGDAAVDDVFQVMYEGFDDIPVVLCMLDDYLIKKHLPIWIGSLGLNICTLVENATDQARYLGGLCCYWSIKGRSI